jgi:hypothetical protein
MRASAAGSAQGGDLGRPGHPERHRHHRHRIGQQKVELVGPPVVVVDHRRQGQVEAVALGLRLQ